MGAHNSGVYVISTPSGRQYVGSAVRFNQRWALHRHHLRNGTHHSRKLQAAWNKYGEQLQFERLLICAREHVVMYEQLAIDALRPELNVAPMAGSSLGYRHTEETKAKFAERKRARKDTPACIAACAAKRGVPLSEEHKAKVQAAKVGVKRSDAARAAMSAAHVGKTQSAETIEKRVSKLRGVPRPAHVVEAMAAAHRGRVVSEEQKAKQRATLAATLARKRAEKL